MWRAFRYRNYRLFFGGQVVSLVGSWITMTATSWLVYRLTNSAFLLACLPVIVFYLRIWQGLKDKHEKNRVSALLAIFAVVIVAEVVVTWVRGRIL